MSLCSDIYDKIGEVEKLKEELESLKDLINRANNDELIQLKSDLKKREEVIMQKLKVFQEELGNLKYNFPEECMKMLNLNITGESIIKNRIKLDIDCYINKLDLTTINLSRLSPEISKLHHLTDFSLCFNRSLFADNQKDDIWKIICGLINLINLNLSSINRLQSLPPKIGNLVNLKELDLSSCDLQSLPLEISNLKNLKELHLDNNPLAKNKTEIAKIQKLLPNTEIKID